MGYNRRSWGNFFVTYNELAGASDYDVWTVPVPINPNLPNAGGTESFVAITPAASARGSRSFMTKEETVAGETRTAYWHGVDVNGDRAAGQRRHPADGDEQRPRRPGHLRVVAGTASTPGQQFG